MKHVLFAIGLLSAALSSPVLADCRSVVAATLAELKAAYPEWDDSMETLVRTAAGSACVKASTASATPAPLPEAVSGAQIEEQAVSADGMVAPMAAETTGAATETREAAADSDDDGGWNPFKEIKFNKVSASPNKKPYERRRDVNNTAPSADDSE